MKLPLSMLALLLPAIDSFAVVPVRIARPGKITSVAPSGVLGGLAAFGAQANRPTLSLGGAWAANGAFFDRIQARSAVVPAAPAAVVPVIRAASRVPVGEDTGSFRSRRQPPPLPGRTPLEKHAAFFDLDGDGVLTVNHTRRRLVQLGLGSVRAAFIATVIHAGLTVQTRDSWWDVVLLRVRVANIQKGIHTGDTGVYDKDGYFNAPEFERMFSQFAKSDLNRLNEDELMAMREANAERRPGFLGKLGAKAEFDLLMDIASDGTEVVGTRLLRTISRAQMRAFYDGTLLYRLVGEYSG